MKKRVLFKKENGEQETPLESYTRAAKFVASGHALFSPADTPKFEQTAIEAMAEGKFMPNSPILQNAGFPNAQCSACFVVPVEDKLASIYKAHHDQGLIQGSGGGTGFYFGHIRSAGTSASNGRFTTKGPISWLKMLNENAGHVVQGVRQGANMAMLDIGHPDIVDFINCKTHGYNLLEEDLAEQFGVSIEEAKRIKSIIGIEKFNISVSIPNKFMETLSSGGDWYLIDPHTKQRVKSIPAKELWDLIVSNAHMHGEPGIFFVDEANKKNPLSHIAKIECTNPCGEVPLIPYGSCTLGHVNLSSFVCGLNGSSKFNWESFASIIRFGVQFLDDVVEINTFPIPELAQLNINSRQIGLGIMGWADTLIKMGIPYDSDEAIKLADEIGDFFDKTSFDESCRLGKDRGNYPYFEGSDLQKTGCKYMRNSGRTTIAPTGQTSGYAGCSSGIEPIMFPVARREQAGITQIEYHPLLFKMLEERELNSAEIKDKLGTIGSARKATFLPDDIRKLFPSAHDIGYEWHVKHQAAWQLHITASISKTINFPKDAKVEDVNNAYLMAHKLGCKGITVYRDGSRINQPISSLNVEKKLVTNKHKRSEVTHGTNRKVETGCGNLMIYVGEGDDRGIQEITARLGKGGGCASAQVEAIARMASIALQHGAEPAYLVKQLSGIRCHLTALHRGEYWGDRPRMISSCADAMSVALTEHLNNGHNVLDKIDIHTGACPSCGGQLVFEEGCSKCYSCDYSRCS